MLRLERERNSKTLGVKLRKKNPLWSRDLAIALGIALFLHLSSTILFRIKAPWHESSQSSRKVQVVTDKISSKTPLSLDLSRDKIALTKPPVREYPKWETPLTTPESHLTLEPVNRKHHFVEAYLRGPFPKKMVNLPRGLQADDEVQVILSLRSSLDGKLFWYEWIKKSPFSDFNKLIENWIKTISFSSEAAFETQILEVNYHP